MLFENTLLVGALSTSDRFSMSFGINIWNSSNGEVVYIRNADNSESQLDNQTPNENQTYANLNPVNFLVDATQQNAQH